MARRVHVVLEDDIDGGLADETVTFSLDGTAFEIDLTSDNARALRSALQPYISAGRRVGGSRAATRSKARSAVPGDPGRSAEIREWARANGIEVSKRGRLSAEVVAQFEAAQG